MNDIPIDPAATDPLHGFMTPEEFAKRLGVPMSRVRRWINEGMVPKARLGNLTFIPVHALTILLADDSAS